MKTTHSLKFTVTLLFMFTLALSACQPILLEQLDEPVQTPAEGPQLATAKVSTQLSNQAGRACQMTTRNVRRIAS